VKDLRFQHLCVENWRNFTRVAVDLAGRVFLVGPNASGKSNLLDVFRFLHDIVAAGGGFAEAAGRRGGVKKLRSLSARKQSDIVVRVWLGSDERPRRWEYELHFSEDARRRPVIRRERVVRDGEELCLRPDTEDQADPERLTQTCLEQMHANREFREVADFFRAVRYLHVVPQLVREPRRSAGRANDPYGGDFLEQMARTPERTRNAWLRQIREALRSAVPQLQELQFYRDNARGAPHLRGNYGHWRPRGAWHNEDQFSDGTLRLVGMLWAVLEGAGLLLLEEPELSLHPDVVHRIPCMLRELRGRPGRQLIVSTHAPAMLRAGGAALEEILLLTPGREGTAVRPARDYQHIAALMEGGLAPAGALLPAAHPEDGQLGLFAGREGQEAIP
jgi:predicted ATPase